MRLLKRLTNPFCYCERYPHAPDCAGWGEHEPLPEFPSWKKLPLVTEDFLERLDGREVTLRVGRDSFHHWVIFAELDGTLYLVGERIHRGKKS